MDGRGDAVWRRKLHVIPDDLYTHLLQGVRFGCWSGASNILCGEAF